MKKAKKLLALFLAMLLCVMCFAGCTKNNEAEGEGGGEGSPVSLEEAEKNKEATLKNALSLSHIFPGAASPFEGLDPNAKSAEVKFSFDMSGITGQEAFLEATAAADETVPAFRMDMNMDTPEIPEIDLSIYADSDALMLTSDAILGSETYGIKLGSLEEIIADFESSELCKMLGIKPGQLKTALDALKTQYGIDENFFANMIAAAEDFAKELKEIEGTLTAEAILAPYVKCLEEVKSEKVNIGGNDIDAIVLTIDCSGDAFKEALVENADLAVAAFTALVDAYEDYFLNIYPEQMTKAMNLSEALSGLRTAKITAGNFSSSLKKALSNCTIDGKISIYVDSADGFAKRLSFDLSVEGKKVSGNFTLNNGIEGEVTANGSTVGFVLKNVSTDSEYSWIFEATHEGEKVAIVFDWDRNSGAFEFSVSSPGKEAFKVLGTMECNGNTFSMTIDSVKAEGETTDLNLALSFRTGVKVNSLGSYKNLFEMSASEIQQAVLSIQSSVMKFNS